MSDEERIRARAHEIWIQEGRPEGRHDQHWEQACREIEAEDAAAAAAVAAASPAKPVRKAKPAPEPVQAAPPAAKRKPSPAEAAPPPEKAGRARRGGSKAAPAEG
jgi:hypothetical protein